MVNPVFRALQPLPWLPPGELGELLRSLHANNLGNEEVLLLRDSRRPGEGKDPGSQVPTGRRTLT